MNRYCEGLILSKKGFGEGHLLLTILDSEYGKIQVAAYGAALETGIRRSVTLTGSFIEGLLIPNRNQLDRWQLSEAKIIFSIENIRITLKAMGFTFFTLEILNTLILEGDIFAHYTDLLISFQLFDQSLDEKYILFFIAKFLAKEGWIDHSDKNKLQTQTIRFINDAYYQNINFLQGKNISLPRKKELAYYYAHIIKKITGQIPHSLELLRFDHI